MNQHKTRVINTLQTRLGKIVCITALCLTSQVGRAHGEPVTLYKETFGFCTATRGLEAAGEADWVALKANSPIGKFGNLKVFPYGSLVVGGSVNSNPIGLSQGYSFWYKPVYGLTIKTSEFSFAASVLRDHDTTVEYEQKLSGVDAQQVPNATQVAFLIDNHWYVSEQATPQSKFGTWQKVIVKPRVLAYGKVNAVPELGPNVPAAYGEALPTTGTVKAFGVFIKEVNGRVRLDNFTIKTAGEVAALMAIAVQEPQAAACPASSPDRNGDTPPPPPPPGDNDDQSDGGTPEHETPQFSMCTGRQQGYGSIVAISQLNRAGLMKKITGTSGIALRDRALIAVLSTRKMPVGAVVNATVGDFNSQTGRLKVKLSPRATAREISLSKATAIRIRRYMKASGIQGQPQAPLFLKYVRTSRTLDTNSAACVTELTRTLSKRAKQSKIVFSRLLVKKSS